MASSADMHGMVKVFGVSANTALFLLDELYSRNKKTYTGMLV